MDVSLLLEHLPEKQAVQQGTTFFSHFKKHGKYYYKHLLRFNYRTGGKFRAIQAYFEISRDTGYNFRATHEKQRN